MRRLPVLGIGTPLTKTASGGKQPEPMAMKVDGGVPPHDDMDKGVPMTSTGSRRTLFFQPEGTGIVRLTVMDARGAADRLVLRLQ